MVRVILCFMFFSYNSIFVNPFVPPEQIQSSKTKTVDFFLIFLARQQSSCAGCSFIFCLL